MVQDDSSPQIESEKDDEVEFYLYEYEGETFGLINVPLKNGTDLDISLSKETCMKLLEKMNLALALKDIEEKYAAIQSKN